MAQSILKKHLSIPYKVIRKIFYSYSHAYIAASNKGIKLHEFYGARKDDIFKSCLAVDNLSFKRFNGSKKEI